MQRGEIDSVAERARSLNLTDQAAPVGKMYDLPLTNDTTLGDRIRDEFLAQSRLGILLTNLFYLNSENVSNRADRASVSDSEKSGARSYYDKYREYVRGALDNPHGSEFVVTQEHLDDTAQAISGAGIQMTDPEYDAFARYL